MKLITFIKNYFPNIKTSKYQGIYFPTKIDLPQKDDLNSILAWPPNVFIIAHAIIEYTDKYRLLVSPQDHFIWTEQDRALVKSISESWNNFISYILNKNNTSRFFDLELYRALENVFKKSNLNKSVYDLINERDFSKGLFLLFLSVDELFSDTGISNKHHGGELGSYLIIRDIVISMSKGKKVRNGNISHIEQPQNLADNQDKYGFVTYKSSVPQSGLTINNMSHNIACIKPSVKPVVRVASGNNKSKNYNVLILPWPMTIEPDSFMAVSPESNDIEMDPYFGFFNYTPDKEPSPKNFLSAVLSAIRRCGSIDLIVLPECSINNETYEKFKKILYFCFKERAPSLLAGVYGRDGECSSNVARLAFLSETGKYFSFEQSKHHRWFLDKNQLRNYNLSSSLDPNKKWWENIRIGRRQLSSLHTKNGVKLCPLICEDLARQEPVAQAVRAIGPNLVISLLLDGPQLSQRWPGKYSAVLSDDPGTSVLSVTALGMTLRSTGSGDKPHRGVALWSEPSNGSKTLSLDEGAIGMVLELELKKEPMWTIDGRAKEKVILRRMYDSSIMPFHNEYTYRKIRKILKNELKKGA
ncbi:hypothetical protein LA366_14660 [Aeromonas jandaei]|uniref:CN hydrolase domain-containing protein n=1 Tax=Aeromonas jandaei TaxID=650 RepID=A0A7T4DQE8_AERJA|nr:hypothetical protein [Aeromonas jandaei]QQB21530.1 hypothetical protein I6H43_08435 [Aeromonas jandaei]UCA32348.1 hypothetical protein LA366_14660 [Aeromonas jandaei]